MKKLTSIIATSLALALAVPAHAGLVNHQSVNGLETFKDTSTNLVWLKLTALFGKTYADQTAIATAAGFKVADLDSLNVLTNGSADISSGNWSSVAAIIGQSTSRDLMWGNYAASASDAGFNGWFYAYSHSSWDRYGVGSGESYSDLGLWAYRSEAAAVPEPMSAGLIGLGLLGFLASRRKRAAK